MLNNTAYRQNRTVAGKLRAAIGDAGAGGKAHIHEVGYQLRLSFAVVVVIPTAIALIYYLLIAAPRYVATAQFAVWTSMPAKADPLAMLVQLPAASASQEDQHIVQDYVYSRSMLESIATPRSRPHLWQRRRYFRRARLRPAGRGPRQVLEAPRPCHHRQRQRHLHPRGRRLPSRRRADPVQRRPGAGADHGAVAVRRERRRRAEPRQGGVRRCRTAFVRGAHARNGLSPREPHGGRHPYRPDHHPNGRRP